MSSMVDQFSELVTLGFVGHEGDIQPSGWAGKDITRDGVLGKAVKITGYVGEPFQIATRAVFNGANLAAIAQIIYKQYQYHLVTFTDDQANTWYNILVLNVENIRVQRYTGGVGSAAGSTHMVSALWTLQSVAIGY